MRRESKRLTGRSFSRNINIDPANLENEISAHPVHNARSVEFEASNGIQATLCFSAQSNKNAGLDVASLLLATLERESGKDFT